MNEKQIEKIIEHLESIADSLSELSSIQPTYNQDNPIHIVDSTSRFQERLKRIEQYHEEVRKRND